MIFIGAFIMVFLAEMGDKSQLIAMSLATRYSIKMVLVGVVLATLVNNGLAVAAGVYLKTMVDLEIIRIFASGAFIFFGVWKLLEKEKDVRSSPAEFEKSLWGSLATVTLVLFLAEIGDKTQLATLAYVINYGSPLQTLLGVVSGMVLADLIGILAGAYVARVLKKEHLLRWISAGIFILLGLIGLGLYFF